MTRPPRNAKALKVDLRGLMSESHLCIDCGYNTFPGCPTRREAEEAFAAGTEPTMSYDQRCEVYIVHDHVWQRAGMELGYAGCLCISCLERRIGRRLRPEDFPSHVFNDGGLPGSARLLDRRGQHLDVLGDFPEDALGAFGGAAE